MAKHRFIIGVMGYYTDDSKAAMVRRALVEAFDKIAKRYPNVDYVVATEYNALANLARAEAARRGWEQVRLDELLPLGAPRVHCDAFVRIGGDSAAQNEAQAFKNRFTGGTPPLYEYNVR